MKYLEYTPGPWEVTPNAMNVIVGDLGIDKHGDISGVSLAYVDPEVPESRGNRRLICAAPDMYLALKRVKDDPKFLNLSIETLEAVTWIIADIERGL